jgi:hypothetical protein
MEDDAIDSPLLSFKISTLACLKTYILLNKPFSKFLLGVWDEENVTPSPSSLFRFIFALWEAVSAGQRTNNSKYRRKCLRLLLAGLKGGVKCLKREGRAYIC